MAGEETQTDALLQLVRASTHIGCGGTQGGGKRETGQGGDTHKQVAGEAVGEGSVRGVGGLSVAQLAKDMGLAMTVSLSLSLSRARSLMRVMNADFVFSLMRVMNADFGDGVDDVFATSTCTHTHMHAHTTKSHGARWMVRLVCTHARGMKYAHILSLRQYTCTQTQYLKYSTLNTAP